MKRPIDIEVILIAAPVSAAFLFLLTCVTGAIAHLTASSLFEYEYRDLWVWLSLGVWVFVFWMRPGSPVRESSIATILAAITVALLLWQVL